MTPEEGAERAYAEIMRTAPPLLRSVLLKFVRAQEHAGDLDRRIIEHMSGSPYLIEAKRQRDPEGYVVVARGGADLPAKLALVFGDFLGNLRASLDHLAQSLVIENGGTPVNEGRGLKTQFPIYLQPPKEGLAVVGGVSKEALTALKGIQPYNRGNVDDPLYILNSLVNIDKHRTVHLFSRVETVTYLRLGFPLGYEDLSHRLVGADASIAILLKEGAEIARFLGPAVVDDVEVEVHGHFMGSIALGEVRKGDNVSGLVRQCLRYVSDEVLPPFERLLG